MAEKKKIKSLADMAIDALTNRDEKAEAAAKAAAEKAAADAKAAAAAVQARLDAKEAAAKKAAEVKKAAEAKAAADKLAREKLLREKQLAEESKKRALEMKAKVDAAAKAAAEAAKPKVVAEYTVQSGDTLSQVALKFYKHATRDYWMLVYEANKAVIGDNPNLIKPGMLLQIPELPESLKK